MILSQRRLAALIAILAWFAVIVQFVMGIGNSSLTVGTYLVRFFSYFTILTNLMVAVGYTGLLLMSGNCIGVFFRKSTTLTALTLYILLVGLVYNVALRSLWHPEGIARLTDELLHSVIPLLVLGYWWRTRAEGNLQGRNLWSWLIYPLIYLFYTLWHGAISGFYPYPFVDVDALGMTKVLMNCGVVAVIIGLLGTLLIGIVRWQAKKPKNRL
ncbi:Pr6Pr family membrane protein [Sphingobacterium yanglingense]|uniref:FAR-17a/AIG1-like protein n=1 Tax=Sphingobacterium yanglingense TaxID=1437280 RepID=A0A4R6W551_9SPHI|nr:Pr6Pr family membrane protein [Sphingobacterium yanglingense]TDQ72265.1 hypothetical protein CLV99_4729 [Sphingobacterium yanglingense]